MNYYYFWINDDYTPVVFCTDDKVIKKGDTIHDSDIEYYALGYTDSLNVKLKIIEIYKKEHLKEYESILKNLEVYNDFAEYEEFLS